MTLVSSSGMEISGDDWLVETLPSRVLRVAAIDGCYRAGEWGISPIGVSTAVWASGTVRTALRTALPAAEALEAAHRLLFDPTIQPSMRRPSAAAAVADIQRDSHGLLEGTAVLAADCFVYALYDVWTCVVGDKDHVTPESRRRWETAKSRHQEHCVTCARGGCEEIQRIESEIFDDASTRVCPALGRDDRLHLIHGRFSGAHAVAVSTDGIVPADLDDVIGAAVRRLARDPLSDITVLTIRPDHSPQ